jgi:hypothetical protein
MKTLIRWSVGVAGLLMAGLAAHGSMPPQIFCWTPESEFPIACEEEEEDDDYRRALPTRAKRHQ